MAGVTLGSLRPKVQHRVSAHDADTILTPEILDEFINEAVQQVNSEVDWPWLQQTFPLQTIIGQPAYNLSALIPASSTRVDNATVTNGSATVIDATITYADQGRPVSGTGIPANTFVGLISLATGGTAPGSFTLSSSAISNVPVPATASATSITIALNPPAGTGGWYRVYSVFDTTDGSRLELRTIQELDRIVYSGVPRIYTVYGDQLWLKPIPQDVRTEVLHFMVREPLLVGDNDALLMPAGSNWEKGIIEYAAYLALRFVREDVRSESAYTAYDRWLKRTRDESIRWKEPLRVRVREGNMI